MSTHSYREVGVAVDGGTLHAGVWDPDGPVMRTVLAVHGITATHQSWTYLPAALPGVRVVAPDLRGRGRSNGLGGPYGMARHADDLAALLSALGTERAAVVGHSMGAFASVVLAHRHPAIVDELVLVDGGLPIDLPRGVDPDALMEAVLGPAVRRLSMTFPDHAAYRAFWADHPAFGPRLVAELGPYFDYDLEPDGAGWRSSSRIEAVTEDQRELATGSSVIPALESLTVPTRFVHAPRGLLDDAPLYSRDHVTRWENRLPTLTTTWAGDLNHYTVVMSPHGARLVAAQLSPTPEGVRP
ncbi:alpha/beta hydrolase [Georgenia sp. H159]|uniref:alpha/beta fold hydrolase n=1 Tax=Georgenia sp. H159 TaxID=3076115 RepID=UPI002D78A4C1|nr:alpha/beta hydrolase [Georgenia sp. H159]